MIKKLKEYLFRYFVRQAGKREAIFPRYEQIRSVLLLYESDYLERNSLIRQISSQLQSEGMTVSTWGYVEKKDITTLILPVGRILGSRDINFFGRPKREVIDDLHKEQWDILIDLSQHDCLPLRYLALEAPAAFKCGLKRDDQVLDFMIDMPGEETPEKEAEQIIRYLKMINR